MEIKHAKLIYFSPTGTTRKVLEGISKGIGGVTHIDLTIPEKQQQAISTASDDLVILGAPVYGGRLPVDAVARFRQIKADQTPAVLIVVYGNREFEDALLELKNLAVELGFLPVAGGAFIGEHSFATPSLPIANGRPDHLDIQKATDLGQQIKKTISALSSVGPPPDLDIPGRFPYEAGGARAMAVSPATVEEACTVCGLCAESCPTAAISVTDTLSTDITRCIRCCACIKACPQGARKIMDPNWESIAVWLHENCSTRKEPQLFGIPL